MRSLGNRDSVGAFGLRVEGFDDPSLLVGVPSAWPSVAVRTVIGEGGDDAPAVIGEDEASTGIAGIGDVTLQRDPARVVVRSPFPVDSDFLVYPVLGWVAWVMACWDGLFVTHGAAFVIDGRAWVALGQSGDGKSTLMAALAQRGVAVLTEDVVVIVNGSVLAGPRRIDLRPDAPASLGLAGTRWIRGRTRRSVSLGSVAPSTPLAGFVRLQWGEEVSAVPIPPFFRIDAFSGFVGALPGTPQPMLDAVAMPMIGLVRPRSWTTIGVAVDAMLTAVAA